MPVRIERTGWGLVIALALGACGSIPRPPAAVEQPVPDTNEWSSSAGLEKIARYRSHLEALGDDALAQEYLEAKRALEGDPVQRLRISLLLSSPASRLRNDEEAIRSLRAFRREPGGRPELVPFAELMLDLLQRSVTEREGHAVAREALTKEQARADVLSRQIEALKAIETTRGASAPAAPDEGQQ